MKVDGRQIASTILKDLRIKVKKLREKNIIPNLAIILVGQDPASKAYVKQKELKGELIGAKTSIYSYPNSVSEKDLLRKLNDLNHLTSVHGIIVQQPLPPHINIEKITQAIDPKKDVDGFHAKSKFEMPIALAVLKILEHTSEALGLASLRGVAVQGSTPGVDARKIVVIGKGETGGKPTIEILKKIGVNPIIIDSKTKKPQSLTKTADIIISAVGKPNIVKPNMIKKGVVLISIGLHKGSNDKLHGDYNEEEVRDKALFYTPTPGGVGPVNVAMLLKNLVISAEGLN